MTLTGTAGDLDLYLDVPDAVRYTGASDVFGDGVDQIGIMLVSEGAPVQYNSVAVNIAPVLSGLVVSASFDENAVNTIPALIDALIQNLTYANISDAPTFSRQSVSTSSTRTGPIWSRLAARRRAARGSTCR